MHERQLQQMKFFMDLSLSLSLSAAAAESCQHVLGQNGLQFCCLYARLLEPPQFVHEIHARLLGLRLHDLQLLLSFV